MTKKEIELLKKLTDTTKEFTFHIGKLTLAMNLLNRVRKCYPHVFSECITGDDLDNLLEKY